MAKKTIKYLLSGALLIFLCYHAVYFKKLDEVKKSSEVSKFDAAKYARQYYKKLVPAASGSMEYNALLSLLKTDPGKAFAEYAHALGIGNIKYFLVHGQGLIQSVNESNLTVIIKSGSASSVANIATEFVYGNTLRDASGIISLHEFNSTADLNNVSAEVNKIVRQEVLPPVMSKVKAGNTITFSGAIELNKKFLDLNDIEIIPVTININQ